MAGAAIISRTKNSGAFFYRAPEEARARSERRLGWIRKLSIFRGQFCGAIEQRQEEAEVPDSGLAREEVLGRKRLDSISTNGPYADEQNEL